MKDVHNSIRKLIPVFLAVLVIVSIGSCKKEDNSYPAMPELTLEGENNLLLKPGTPIVATLNFDAPGPDTRLLIKKNGGPYRSIRLANEAVSYTFQEDAISPTAIEGETIRYEFMLTNGANTVKTDTIGLTVSVEVYSTIVIGSTVLYNIDVPDDGILTEGEITLAAGRKYYLSSSVQFSENTVFNVGAGAEIYVNTAAEPQINMVFDPGSLVHINGTAIAPVVITSDRILLGEVPQEGDWGNFNIKGDGNGSTSGSIKYLRLEYPGSRAFRLQDVGNGTSIDYVQVYQSSGEAIMPTNGDVNMSHLITTEANGSGYRIGDAYSGNIQFAIAMSPTYVKEADEFAIRETASPTISNLTIVGPGNTNNTHGIRLSASSAAKIYNSIVAFYPRRGVRLNDQVETVDINGPTVFAYSYVFQVPSQTFREDRSGGLNPFQGFFSNGVASNPYFNNIIFSSSGSRSYEEIAGIAVGDYTPAVRKESSFSPTALSNFFQEAAFVGAVESPESDWTIGWVRNPDGSLRTKD